MAGVYGGDVCELCVSGMGELCVRGMVGVYGEMCESCM